MPFFSPASARRTPSASQGRSSNPKKPIHPSAGETAKMPLRAKSGAASSAPKRVAPRSRAYRKVPSSPTMIIANAVSASPRDSPKSSVKRNVGDRKRACGVPRRYIPPQ